MDNTQLNMIIAIGTVLSSLLSIWGILTKFSDKLEKRFDKIDQRFVSIDQRFDKMDQRINERFNKQEASNEYSFEKIDQRFDNIDFELKDIRKDISELKERLSFVEATSIYSMPIEPPIPNPRSQAAREMWQRRRQKKLEQKN